MLAAKAARCPDKIPFLRPRMSNRIRKTTGSWRRIMRAIWRTWICCGGFPPP